MNGNVRAIRRIFFLHLIKEYRKCIRLDTTKWARWSTGNCARNLDSTIRTNDICTPQHLVLPLWLKVDLGVIATKGYSTLSRWSLITNPRFPTFWRVCLCLRSFAALQGMQFCVFKVWFGLVLWYINHCWLFIAKFFLYIYTEKIWFISTFYW